jgi:hypothetical protein
MVTLQGSEHIAQMTRCAQFRNWCRPKRPALSWFSLKQNHTSRSLPRHRNCETALVLLMEERVVDVRPDFLESEGTAING